MSWTSRVLLAAVLGWAVLLGACVFRPGGGTDLPPCRPEELVAPTNLTPGQDQVVESRSPAHNPLTWDYSGECQPSAFRVEVLIPAEVYARGGYHMEVDGSSRSTSIGPLDTGQMYTWRVTAMSGSDLGPASRTEVFFTRPICSSADRGSYLAPSLLRPLDGEVIRSTIHITTSTGETFDNPSVMLEWEDPNLCLPPEGYGVQVSRDPTFRRTELEAGSIPPGPSGAHRTTAQFFWGPGSEWHDCERYYWRVIIGWPWTSSGGVTEEPYSRVYAYSDVRSFLINTTGMVCPPDLGVILTPIPWIDLPGGSSIPTGTLNQPANCRSGPGTDYPALDILAQGLSVQVNGRNSQRTWWQVMSPNLQLNCWLAAGVIDVGGDTGDVPVVQVAPPPVAVPSDTPVPPVNCAQYTSNTCNQNPACTWKNGACVNK